MRLESGRIIIFAKSGFLVIKLYRMHWRSFPNHWKSRAGLNSYLKCTLHYGLTVLRETCRLQLTRASPSWLWSWNPTAEILKIRLLYGCNCLWEKEKSNHSSGILLPVRTWLDIQKVCSRSTLRNPRNLALLPVDLSEYSFKYNTTSQECDLVCLSAI